MKTGFVVALLAIAMLCASSLAQEDTANDWYKKGQSLIATGFGYNIDEALEAFDNAIQIEPQNIDAWLGKAKSLAYMDEKNESLEAFRNILNLTNETIKENPEDTSAWQSKGIALASLGREAEATDAFERSIELLNQSLLNDPKDAEAWWLKAENLELLGRSDSALEAYDKVIELNSSEAVGAWLRKSDIFYGLPGGYNQSQDAFGEAVDLMEVNSTSFISFWYPEGDHTIILNEWMIDGQIVRVDFGRYNRSIQAYDDLVQTRTKSGLFAAWQNKGRAITPLDTTLGKPSEYLLGSSPNWVVYNFSSADFPVINGSADLQEGSFEDNSAEDWFNRGQELQRNDSHEEALQAFDKAIEINQSYAFAWGGKGYVLYNMGRYDDAIAAWDRAIELEPDEFYSGSKWEMKGKVLEILGRNDESAQAYERALELADKAVTEYKTSTDLNLSAAWGFKGQLLDDQGRYVEALEAVANSSKANPEDAFAWVVMGDILADRLGRYNESIESYNKSLEIDPKNIGALRGEGYALASLGRYEEALEYYNRALEIDSRFARAWQGLGDALRNMGMYNESIQAYDRAIAEMPQQPQYALIGKGMALDSLGRYDEAQEDYEQALKDYDDVIKKNPRNAQVMYNQGNALRGLQRHNESLQAYDRAIELNPGYIDAWRGKAIVLRALGGNAEAEEASAKAMDLGYMSGMVTAVAGSGLIVAERAEMMPEAEETGPRR